MASYTAKEVDRMTVEELEQLGDYMSIEQLAEWSEWGYSGDAYVRIMDRPDRP